ncbi:MAG: GNAT family N-acetyltransferase [Chloroflexota bacterium]
MIIKQLPNEYINRLGEIDRAEFVRFSYRYQNGELITQPENFQVPRWDKDEVAKHVKQWGAELERGGILYGALDGDTLAGVSMLGHRFLGENQDHMQLYILFVSHDYRRQGLATKLMSMVEQAAIERGARYLYISATESESAVGFYRSQGCVLADKVDPDLYAKEPEDIHMVKKLVN